MKTIQISIALLIFLTSAASAGTEYSVACKIVTSLARTDERTIEIIVEER